MFSVHSTDYVLTFVAPDVLISVSAYVTGEVFDYLVAHGRMKEKEARAKFRQVSESKKKKKTIKNWQGTSRNWSSSLFSTNWTDECKCSSNVSKNSPFPLCMMTLFSATWMKCSFVLSGVWSRPGLSNLRIRPLEVSL